MLSKCNGIFLVNSLLNLKEPQKCSPFVDQFTFTNSISKINVELPGISGGHPRFP